MSQAEHALSNFTGAWQPLNWIGSQLISAPPNATNALFIALGPIGFSKFYAPIALLLLGISGWLLCRQLGFHPLTCVLGGLALALSGDPFSYACWGLPSVTLAIAFFTLALAGVAQPEGQRSWLRCALAGLAVGVSIMEGYDVGAILSLFVAAFAFFQSWNRKPVPQTLGLGAARVALVALVAALAAAHALSALVGTQIKGIVGTQQDTKTKEQRWNEATIWSLPKIETLRVVVPGLFGYRMDTPDGGNYWGSVGQTPGVPQSRHSGSGVFAGVLVVLIAFWAVARAAHSKDSPYTDWERRLIFFWAGAAAVSLLLAYGRHAPFYQFFYQLPYFSTIRNPIKFMHPFAVSMAVLFACGVEGLIRAYFRPGLARAGTLKAQAAAWWKGASPCERWWAWGSMGAVVAAALGALLYTASRRELEQFLQGIASEAYGFPPGLVPQVARFSLGEAGWFVVFLVLAATLVLLIMSGALSGARRKWAGFLLAGLLVVDFARANAPWIIYYNYREKYASNPVLDLLRQNPFERRVAARVGPLTPGYLVAPEAQNLFSGVVDREWLQQHYQYYKIQSLDIVQMPRIPEVDYSYLTAMAPKDPSQSFNIGRLWQLTNTRYILGMTAFLDAANLQIDPTNQSFRVRSTFDFVPRQTTGAGVENITTVLRPEGQFALFEFGAALPRAQLFGQWQVLTNDAEALARLADPAFDPRKKVLLSDPLPPPAAGASTNAGQVAITRYEPKRIVLDAAPVAPAILLLNDKFDPNWRVTVDGQKQPLLRCNYIMRGVQLTPGQHQVEFRFDPPHGALYLSLATIAAGLVLGVLLFVGPLSTAATTPSIPRDPVRAKPRA